MRLFRLLSVLIGLLLTPLLFAQSHAAPGPLETTSNCFRQVLCMDENRYHYYKDVIKALSYTKMKALRAFCSLSFFTADQAIETLERLVFYPISFDQVTILEFLTSIESATPEDCWKLLEKTADLDFTAMQAASAAGNIKDLSPATLFSVIDTLEQFDESGRWAAKALLQAADIHNQEVMRGLEIIKSMNTEQRWSAEKCALLAAESPPLLLKMLSFVSHSSDGEAANIGGLFSLPTISAEDGLFWLDHYFSRSRVGNNQLYPTLSNQQKSLLLSAFSKSSQFFIWKINNLHAVTDRFGTEISSGSLARKNEKELTILFEKLHPEAVRKYRHRFTQSLKEKKAYDAVGHLKNATALARKLTAGDLSTANIYVLLSHGSELYDSSFRDILAPILLARIRNDFNGNLLGFLTSTDPENLFISDFIISCAQKGKLTSFFPEKSEEQRNIIDLVTESAFRNEQSLILFSATFNTLLEKITPEVRTYLIDKIISTIKQPDSVFALQLRVILQYYFEKYGNLLSESDKQTISSLIELYGSVDLGPYTATDFKRWKEDNSLASLSIFQYDDDGALSYRSNTHNLIRNGYRPRLSHRLSLLPTGNEKHAEAKRLLDAEKKKPGSQIGNLYRLSVTAPVIVEWYKTINDIELSHAVAVYQDRASQQQLLKLFLEQEIEMFAQRGHSYWRREQLLSPMQALLEKKEISPELLTGMNRFMSIGSCGGIRAYTELNKLFENSIDILATVGTGKAVVNDPYNQKLFEIVATSADTVSWDDIARKSRTIFEEGRGSDYLQPGSLPAILHKMMDNRRPE